MITTGHHAAWAREITADILTAKQSITLTAISCLPPRGRTFTNFGELWHAITGAAAAGVSVRFILPEPQRAHPATLRNESAQRAIAAFGGQCTLVKGPNLLHAKTVLIDTVIAWCGSGNWTAAAANHNRECWLRTTDPIALAAIAHFQATMS